MIKKLIDFFKPKRNDEAWQLDQLDIITATFHRNTKHYEHTNTEIILKSVGLDLAKIFQCDGVWLLSFPITNNVSSSVILNWRNDKDKWLSKNVPPISDAGIEYHNRINASTDVVIDDSLEIVFPGRQVSSALARSIKVPTGEQFNMGIHQSVYRKWTNAEIRLFREIGNRLQSVLSIWCLYKKMDIIAHYDELTGLPNRLMFQEQSTQIMTACNQSNSNVSVFLVDLDNFKQINDTHGHQAGDIVLQEISHRLDAITKARCVLQKNIGEHNNCSCVVSRLGGDEFVIAFEDMGMMEAELLGQQLVQELKEPIILPANINVSISSSIGISIFPTDGKDIHQLMTSADLAMYSAKDEGKDQICFHNQSMNTKVERRIEAELAIREMINSKSTIIYYQPIVNIDGCQIIGAEALLRGKHAIDKFFNPVELITAAENTNLIIPLGEIILRSACKFARNCIDVIGEEGEIFVSVNVSAMQLTAPIFAGQVERALHDSDLTPDHLVLEITETMLMQNFEDSARTLEKLRELGIRISIDDFGKGYSSFSYLQKLPIDKIKIDSSFIQTLGTNNKSNEIVKGIILMAEALGMHTCAEGVETDLQFNKLKEYGCEQIQGYYKYKALSEEDFVDVLKGKTV